MNKAEIEMELGGVKMTLNGAMHRVQHIEDAVKALPAEPPAHVFERGDRVRFYSPYYTEHDWTGDIVSLNENGSENIKIERDDGTCWYANNDTLILITAARDRKVEKGDKFADVLGVERIAASVETYYLIDTNGNHHIEKCIFRYRPKKPAHKWEAGQWAHWVNEGDNCSFQIESVSEVWLFDCTSAGFHKTHCTPIPAPAFEIGQEVALKGNGMIFAINSRRWGNDAKRWLYDEHYELELTAQLPKFKVGDEVNWLGIVYPYPISEIKWHSGLNGWVYAYKKGSLFSENQITLAPASGWKVGDMAVMIYDNGIKTIFEVKEIVPNEHLLVSKDGCMYRFENCRHLVSMQVEGEKREEIKPGRWVRTPSGWEGLTVRQFNDGDWHVIEPAHGGGGLFKSSSLILINRPPEVLR